MFRKIFRFFSGAGLLALSPLSISLATLLSVPLLVSSVGQGPWLSIAVGQAVGELSRAVVIWGWNSIGLARVAPMKRQERVRYYFDSLAPRLLILPIVLTIGVVIVWMIPLEDPLAAVLAVATAAVYGLTASWVLIGAREPLRLLALDAIPRAVSILVGSVVAALSVSGVVFGIFTLTGSIVAIGLPFVVLARQAWQAGSSVRLGPWVRTAELLREGLPAMGAGLVGVSRLSFAVVVSPVLNAPLAAGVALGDKFLRWANTGMTPLMQTLQVRIPRGSRPLRERAVQGIIAAWALGAMVGAAVALTAPWLSRMLTLGEIPLEFSASVPIGIAIMFVFVAGITGNSVLVLLGRVQSLFVGSVIGLVALTVAFIPLFTYFGVPGAFWSMVLAEGCVVVYQILMVIRGFREHDKETHQEPGKEHA